MARHHLGHSRLLACALLLTPICLAAGCSDDDDGDTPGIDGGPDGGGIDSGLDGSVPATDASTDGQVVLPDGAVPVVGDTWAYTNNKKLVKFARATGQIEKSVDAVVPTGETVWGVDVRPADGKLYALTSVGNLYTVDPATGAFADKKTLAAAAGDDNPYVTLDGTAYAVDFNPVADRLRIVSNTGQNLRVNVTDGTVTTDALVGGQTEGIASAAYTNSYPAPCGTSLYVIGGYAAGTAPNTLYLQNPPNAGTLTAIGTLPDVAGPVRAFDIITGATGQNTAIVVASGTAGELVYQIDLSTAKSTALGTLTGVGTVEAVFGLTPSTAPVGKIGELVATTTGLVADASVPKVISFERGTPGTTCTNIGITGFDPGEEVVGGDVRPADNRLYVVTTYGNLYRLDVATGVASAQLELTAAADDVTNPFTALAPDIYGVGFNPVADRLRVVSRSGANLRINVVDGKVTTDTNITGPGATGITEVAYTNPTGTVPATSTTLFALDTNDRLGTIPDPNAGVFTGPFAVPPTSTDDVNGIDIEPVSNFALGALTVPNTGADAATVPNVATLFNFDPLRTPVSISFGRIGEGTPVTSLSFAPKP